MRTVVVSRGPSAVSARRVPITLVAPAAAIPPRKPRRVWISAIARLPLGSRLQLAFEFVQETPIGIFGDDLLRGRFDKPRFTHAQRIIAKGVFRIVLTPFV